MTFPLVSSFVHATEQSRLQHDARTYLQEVLSRELRDHSISRIQVFNASNDRLIIEADVLIPEGVPVFAETQELIESSLRQQL